MSSTLQESRKVLERLGTYLSRFTECFGHVAQKEGAVRYVQGLLGTAEHKNMTQIWEELSDPGDYQSLQHFVTSSPWSDEKVWKKMRTLVPERTGYLIFDDTGIPKQGKKSVGVKRQYCGALGKIGNCQIAVSSMLKTQRSSWLLAMDLYLPEEWSEDNERREKADIPDEINFRTKGEIALDQLDEIFSEGFTIKCVLADADYGDRYQFRAGIANRGLFYAVGIRSMSVVYPDKPRMIAGDRPGGSGRTGRPRKPKPAKNNKRPVSVKDFEKFVPEESWNVYKWKKATGKGFIQAECAVTRVTPAGKRQQGYVQSECWLVIERREEGSKYYFSNLPSDTNPKEIVKTIHERWAIEQNYRHLKNELGLDHFAGRTWEGWNHHAVMTAVAYTFLELERYRHTSEDDLPPLPALRKFIRRVFLALYIATDRDAYSLVQDFHRSPPFIKVTKSC